MAEEGWRHNTDGTGCQAPEGHRLCANNCGFFGSPATLNLCSKCYRDYRLKEEQASSAKAAVEKSLNGAAAAAVPVPSLFAGPSAAHLKSESSSSCVTSSDPPAQQPPNRCSSCRKRVGLTGFRCRCGLTFCSSHRYPEAHKCDYDYKLRGQDLIRKANPLVKAEKLEKI